jgi:superfamily II DNA/RNA helicase
MDKQWTVESNEQVEVYNNFESMKLNEKLLRGIFCYGFEKPSAV